MKPKLLIWLSIILIAFACCDENKDFKIENIKLLNQENRSNSFGISLLITGGICIGVSALCFSSLAWTKDYSERIITILGGGVLLGGGIELIIISISTLKNKKEEIKIGVKINELNITCNF
jgi:hypothetical protein